MAVFSIGVLLGFAAACAGQFAISRSARRRLACRKCGRAFHHHESAALCEQVHRCPVGRIVSVSEDAPVAVPARGDADWVMEDEAGDLIDDWVWTGSE